MEYWQWLLAIFGALLTGLGKGGVPGVGNLTVVIFAAIFEPKASVGLLLPILIAADLVAIRIYRHHVEWSYLRRLLPWMVVGVLVGYFAFELLDSRQFQQLIGIIVLSMTFLRILKLGKNVPHHWGFRSFMGLIGGFATMVANAAGPVAHMYFLAVRLPKMVFIGTGAWCFFIINVFKVPFQVDLGIIHTTSLQTSLLLAPIAMLGVLLAPYVVKRISQLWFERLVWVFIIVAGLRLVWV